MCAITSLRTPPGGASRDRTDDPLLAKQVLSQLSYGPRFPCQAESLSRTMVGLGGLEPPTSPLSGVRSNHLSYRPNGWLSSTPVRRDVRSAGYLCGRPTEQSIVFARKEVIQPHLPIRLPCYDFTPVIDHSVVSAPLAVRLPTSGATNSHGVTGGVYKARERIHRGILIRDY